MTKYNNPIIDYIMKGIFEKDFVANQKIPSQFFFTIKFNVSRIVVTNTLNKLRNSGVIYSIPKKGYYISEHLSNVIRPFILEYDITRTDKLLGKVNKDDEETLKKAGVQLVEKIKKLNFKYFKNDDLIIDSIFLVSGLQKLDYLNEEPFINTLLLDENRLTSIVSKVHFEDDQLILIKIYYGGINVLAVSKNKIKKEEFKFIKEEFNLS